MTQEGGAGGGGGGGIQSLTSPDGSITVGGTSQDTTVENARPGGSTFYPAEGWYWTVYEGTPVSNNSFAATDVVMVPIDIHQPVTVETIAMFTTAAVGANTALGLYSDVNGMPDVLLASSVVAGTGTITWSPNYVTSSTVWIGLFIGTSAVTIDSLSTVTYPIQPSNPRYTFNPVVAGGQSFGGVSFCFYASGQAGLPNPFVWTPGNKLQFCPRFQVKILPS